MMLKSKLATLAGALILAGSAFANSQITCPDINDIKSVGLSNAEPIGADMYLTYQISKYNTPNTYGFFLAPIEGNSSENALETANEILNIMNAPGVPTQYHGTMMCLYETGHSNIMAAAIEDDSVMSPTKLKQYWLQAHKAR
ncbi:DUF4949 domain-containing protein [Legionella fallonii]|uniref:Hemin binding protein Hbp n=1 Tax=Legionella fallonii LLAP-10 TaxID=1212491 RepID=A0A098G7J5_9GAMM|nr:DUF4949 domain-containing protein [Legionella fallonii]CEG58428.1 Hemin binding protein Hbp [Legionella fallonii LLAP-10]